MDLAARSRLPILAILTISSLALRRPCPLASSNSRPAACWLHWSRRARISICVKQSWQSIEAYTALRRALAAGASVHARFVPDTYDDGRRHGCAHGRKEPINVAGQRPAVFAVLEDDVIALRILLDAGAPRRDALGVLNVVEDQGIERERIRWCLETPELDAVVAREGGAATGRERRRL